MSKKDVFGLGGSDDEDATRVRVTPATPPKAPPDAFDDERTVIGRAGETLRSAPAGPAGETPAAAPVGSTPLVAAASRMLMLAGSLSTLTASADPQALRQHVDAELDRYVAQARASGVTEETIKRGHYALCALIDDVVMATPWGARSSWSSQSLIARHHNEVVSGERMLHLAEQVSEPGGDPGQRLAMAQLLYHCFSLGFEGRLRIDPRGRDVLANLRERLARVCRELGSANDLALSTAWAGVNTRIKPLRRALPLWVWWAGAAGIAALVFAVLFFALAQRSNRLTSELATLAAPLPKPIVRDVPAPVDRASDLYDRVRHILAPDIAAGRVEVRETARAVVVRMINDGLFASGSAAVSDAYQETLQRMAQAAALSSDTIDVVGHTDNAPIRGRSLAFPDNFALSKARAQAVDAAMAAAGLTLARTISGAGDTQPVTGNDTPEGKAQNRRVEVTIYKPQTWQLGILP